MIHVEKLQSIKRLVGRLTHAILLHIFLGVQILLNDRTDDRGQGQQKQGTDRQFQGTEQIPQLVGEAFFFTQVAFSYSNRCSEKEGEEHIVFVPQT